jgi:hypothetical protein
MYCTNPHTVQELQVDIDAVAGEITGDMLHDKVDDFVVKLQQVHSIEESHIEHTFT